MNLPTTVGPEVLHDVLRALGVPEERWRDMLSLSVSQGVWRVELARTGPDGRPLWTRNGDGIHVVKEIYEMKVTT